MVIPGVKHEQTTDRIFWRDTALSICVCDAYAEKACTALRAFLPQCTVTRQTQDAFITVLEDARFAGEPEAYRLELCESGVVIGCADYMGLRNALAAFSTLAVCRNGALQLPETCIGDAPAAKHRGVMLDLAGGIKPLAVLYSDLTLMAKARMNRVQLYLFDRLGTAVQLKCLPESCWMEGAYTRQQMRELCAFADALGLTVIPEFDMPAHSPKLLEVFESFRCGAAVPEGKAVTSVCTGEPTLYALYENIIHELLDIFPGPYFHMGGDEVEMLDLNVVCLWDDCPKCRKLRKENDLADRQEQYYYFVRRIHEIVRKAGRTLIMWSDQLDCPRGAQLPQDIIMHFWRVAHPGRGPCEGCSMQAQAALGYTIINSYYPETYTFTGESAIMSAASLARWRWDREPDCDEAFAPQIIGSELCAWGYTLLPLCSYMDRFLPSAIVLMADKLWSGGTLEYTDEYRRLLTRVLLGAAAPEGLNIFAAIGDLLPPAENDRACHSGRVTCSRSELEAIRSALSLPEIYLAGDALRADAYRACAEYALKTKNPDEK